MRPAWLRIALRLVPLLALGGCVVLFQRPRVVALDPAAPPVSVTTPVKAHLADGSVVLFPQGARFSADSVRGAGTRYRFDLSGERPVRGVGLDSVLALEAYSTSINQDASAAVSVVTVAASTALVTLGVGLLAIAIFGSCPTTYSSDGAGGLALEAESFSNSVAPLLEVRDVDAPRARPDADGRMALEVRNEALETHYHNHLELVEAAHRPDETAVPAPLGGAYALGPRAAPTAAASRGGTDVAGVLARDDGAAYATDARVVDGVTEADPTDHVELTFPAPDADSAAVSLRLRNSLLSTVYFYEFMLAAQGAEALDWIGEDLATVSTAIEMGDYYERRMGLRVDVHDGADWREVGRVVEAGPIAWSEVAVAFAVPEGVRSGEPLRVRLRFVADGWRIDRAALAPARRVPVGPVPLARVDRADGAPAPEALDRLGRADQAYLVTQPGERFTAHFEPGVGAPGRGRTFFLAAQGYYVEWVRGAWVRERLHGEPFRADDATLVAAIRRWDRRRAWYEAQFEATRIPVR